MTRILIDPLCALLLLSLSQLTHAEARLRDLLEGTSVTPALSGLQVSLMRGGVPGASFALGFSQLADIGPLPLRRDHKVRVASISKLAVAVGVMRLVDAGKLALDDDVSTHLGWQLRNPSFPKRRITIRQLLTHTSSVRDGRAYFIAAGEGELRDFFLPGSEHWDAGEHFASGVGREPGAYFSYSNLNFGLLGTVIENVSRQRFDRYMRREVIAPLGVSADFDPCRVAEGQRAAAFRKRDSDGNWNPNGPWHSQVDGGVVSCFYGMQQLASPGDFLDSYALGSNASLFSPQGGLRASADDLLTLIRTLALSGKVNGERLLSAEVVDDMLAPQWELNPEGDNGLSAGEAAAGGPSEGLMTSYGLSVHRIDMRAWGFESGPPLLLGHLGEAYGVLSHALFDPESGDGIATIISGTADDPAASPFGSSPLYRVEEEVLRWWVQRRAITP